MKKIVSMKRIPKLLGALLLLSVVLLFTGCLDMRTIISVNKDGSGTVEQRFLMQKQFVEMLQGMAAMSGEGQDDSEGSFMYKPEELKANAAGMGKGVRFKTAEPLETSSMEGYRVVYSFSDINTLRVNQNPGDAVPAPSDDGDGEQAPEYLTFSFKKGPTATVQIHLPDEKDSDDAQDGAGSAGAEPKQEDIDMAKQLYKDMRLTMLVKFNGSIVKTNATHRNGSEITLMDMDFGKIMSNDELVKKLAAAEAESLEATKAYVNNVPGVKVEQNQTVEVQFN